MASVVIAGDTSGTVTLAAPAVAGTTTLTLPTVNGTVLTNASSIARSQMPSGAVLQVVYSQLNTTQSFASTSYVTISGLSCVITPTSASSRFLILFSCVFGGTPNFASAFRILRNGTFFNQPSGSNSLAHTGNEQSGSGGGSYAAFSTVDSPATTSQLTYTVAFGQESSQTTLIGTLATSGSGSDPAFPGNFPTTLTVLEIA